MLFEGDEREKGIEVMKSLLQKTPNYLEGHYALINFLHMSGKKNEVAIISKNNFFLCLFFIRFFIRFLFVVVFFVVWLKVEDAVDFALRYFPEDHKILLQKGNCRREVQDYSQAKFVSQNK